MKDIISILKKYFNEKDINKLVNNIEKKQRGNVINDNYFAKLGKNTNKLFFNNLVKEIRLYENNKDDGFLPNLVDSYVSNNYCLIVLYNKVINEDNEINIAIDTIIEITVVRYFFLLLFKFL